MMSMLKLKKYINKHVKWVKKIKKHKLLKNRKIVPVGLVLITFVIFVLFLNALFLGRVFLNVYIASINIGGKTSFDAVKKLEQNIEKPEIIFLIDGSKEYEINTEEIDFYYDFPTSVNSVMNYTKTGNFLHDQATKLSLLFKSKNLGLRIKLDHEKLNGLLQSIINEATDKAEYPSMSFENKNIVVNKGKKGTYVELDRLEADVEHALSLNLKDPIKITKQENDKTLTDDEADEFQKRGELLLNKKITLNFEYQSFALTEEDLVPLLDPYNEYSEENLNKLIDSISEEVDRDVQNPVFNFTSGRVVEFAPAKEGIVVKKQALKEMLVGNLRILETEEEKSLNLEIPVLKESPDTETEDINDLGIKTLIGRGTSTFWGSISSRIYNISHASGQLNGILVKPGETFSFNNALGDVSELTGYKQAYVIRDGQTVLGDGGGVCQVSTTLFRAALDAGLPITERRYHAYRVGYYEQDRPVGFDATVYSPTTDLKIKNDTPAHILIQTTFNAKTASLVFEIYGTDDGRTSLISDYTLWDSQEPPEDLYIDDPTLPTGQIKQIDYKAWGAKAKFTYTVKRAGEIIYKKIFYSIYQPWQAKFLRGTGATTI